MDRNQNKKSDRQAVANWDSVRRVFGAKKVDAYLAQREIEQESQTSVKADDSCERATVSARVPALA